MTESGTCVCSVVYNCEETVLCGTLSCCAFRASFQGYVNSEQPWMIEIVSPSEAKDRLLYCLL